MRKLSIVFIYLIISIDIFACSYKENFNQGFEKLPEMIESSETIFLGKVLLDENSRNDSTRFRVIEYLKGQGDEIIQLELSSNVVNESLEKEVSHYSFEFWLTSLDRTGYGSDCRITPTFTVGDNYLIFVNDLDYPKMYEKVDGYDDPWFDYVKNYPQSKNDSPIFKELDFVCEFHEVTVRRCESFSYESQEFKEIKLCEDSEVDKLVSLNGANSYVFEIDSNGYINFEKPFIEFLLPQNIKAGMLVNEFATCK